MAISKDLKRSPLKGPKEFSIACKIYLIMQGIAKNILTSTEFWHHTINLAATRIMCKTFKKEKIMRCQIPFVLSNNLALISKVRNLLIIYRIRQIALFPPPNYNHLPL